MKIEISASEARTRLLELLRQVEAGKRFTITYRGRAVADLVPTKNVEPLNPRAAIDKFQAFMRANPAKGRHKLGTLIQSGRE